MANKSQVSGSERQVLRTRCPIQESQNPAYRVYYNRRNCHSFLTPSCEQCLCSRYKNYLSWRYGHVVRVFARSDIVYLFMTGPNLPSNGVALNNINRRADVGGFSTADVDPDGRWVYKWYTNQLGGKIDAGTYTVWVTDRPVDRSHLSGSDYRSITVVLQQPGISAGSSTATGALLVRSIPDGAVLFLNGENRGVTPVTIPDLPVGGHVLVLSSPGYQNMTTQVIVREGAITEVNVPLSAVNGSLYVNTTPGGAEISLDGRQAGVSPVLLEDLAPGNHSLVAGKSGYNTTDQEVRVIGGHMMVVQLSLGEGTPTSGTFPPATRAPGTGPALVMISIISSILLVWRTRQS